MKKVLIMMAVAAGLVLGASAAPIEWWNMNDSSGTDLNDLSNSGSIDSIWNFNTPGMTTDGNGMFVIAGDGETTTRKLPKKGSANAIDADNDIYATPITSGAYSLTVDFDSWIFDSGSEGDLWKLKAVDSSGVDIAGIELGIVSGAGRIRLWTTADGGSYYRSFAFNATEAAGALAEVRFDLDNDTVAYYIDGNEEYSWDDFNGANIGGMALTTSGDGIADWSTAASSISIDEMGLNVIPEPATLGMMAIGGLFALMARRFKQ